MCRTDDASISTSFSLLSESENKLLNTFRELNSDNQDIIIGEIKKLLKEQQREERITQKNSLKKAT